MKLYLFYPNGYNQNYIIMSNSREEAITNLLLYLSKTPHLKYDYKKWKNAVESESFPDKYTLEEHGLNDVINIETA